MAVKAKKRIASKRSKGKRVKSLGRSPLAGAPILKPVAKGATVSSDKVGRAVRVLKSVSLRASEFTPEEQARIQKHISARGITFEVFLPESLAQWLQMKLADDVFSSPAEAAFVAFQQLQRLDEHPQVREQLLEAVIKHAVQDPRSGVPAEELADKFHAQLSEWATMKPPRPRPIAKNVDPAHPRRINKFGS